MGDRIIWWSTLALILLVTGHAWADMGPGWMMGPGGPWYQGEAVCWTNGTCGAWSHCWGNGTCFEDGVTCWGNGTCWRDGEYRSDTQCYDNGTCCAGERCWNQAVCYDNGSCCGGGYCWGSQAWAGMRNRWGQPEQTASTPGFSALGGFIGLMAAILCGRRLKG